MIGGGWHLNQWFELSYASFLTLPRVLMQDMPDEWQGKMADLLDEYDATFPNQDHIPQTRVQGVDDQNKICKLPDWLCNYRRPNQTEINNLKENNHE